MAEIHPLFDTGPRVSVKKLDEFAAAIAARLDEGPHVLRPAKAPPATHRAKEGKILCPLVAAEWVLRSITMPDAFTRASRKALIDGGLRNSTDGNVALSDLLKRIVQTQPGALDVVAARFGATIFFDEVPDNVVRADFSKKAQSKPKISYLEINRDELREYLASYGEDFVHEVIAEASLLWDAAFESQEELASFVIENWPSTCVGTVSVITALGDSETNVILREWLLVIDLDLVAANSVRS